MSSSAAICAICFEEARPIFEDLQFIPACGHVFHEPCLQQWMEYCPAGRDPTCPLCKRSISGPAHDVHRLYFQSAGSDSTEPQVSQKSQVSRILQTAVEDLKHVNCSSAFCKLESKLAAAMTIVYALESQVAVTLQRAEKAEAATVVARSELSQCRQDLTNIQEELMCLSLKLEKMQEEIGAMKKGSLGSFFRFIRDLREDRENWNLPEADVLELVELAKMRHHVLRMDLFKRGMNSFKV